MRDWECGDLPESVSLGEELVLVRYPALVDSKRCEFGYSQKKTVLGSHQRAITPLHAEKRTVKKTVKKQLEFSAEKCTEIPA